MSSFLVVAHREILSIENDEKMCGHKDGGITSSVINYWILLCHQLNEVFFNRCNKVYLYESRI